MKIITLLFTYNSRLELKARTRYDSIWMPLAVYRDMQWIRATCMKIMKVAFPQIQCQLHDHAKSNMTKVMCVIWTEGGKLDGNISHNGYGNAIIGRYGGCFEEGYMVGLMHRWNLRGTRESSNGGRVRVCIIHGLNISHKELTYSKNLLVIETKYYAHAPRGIDW